MNEDLKRIIDNSNDIVLFSGAGISCASGIPDFRSADGLYNRQTGLSVSPEEIVSHDFITNRPQEFYDFYKKNMVYENARPNKAHLYFARLEREGKLKAVVTQNIDGLHQKAGSKNVIELHGSIHRNYCVKCNKRYGLNYILDNKGIPKCSCGSMVRPDVVLYGEALDETVIDKAISAIFKADCLIVAGTSLSVYPAASFVEFFRGKNLVLINKDKTPLDSRADLVINDAVESVVE